MLCITQYPLALIIIFFIRITFMVPQTGDYTGRRSFCKGSQNKRNITGNTFVCEKKQDAKQQNYAKAARKKSCKDREVTKHGAGLEIA